MGISIWSFQNASNGMLHSFGSVIEATQRPRSRCKEAHTGKDCKWARPHHVLSDRVLEDAVRVLLLYVLNDPLDVCLLCRPIRYWGR